MMFYAFEGGVSTSFTEGAIEITEQQYRDAIDGMLAGKVVNIENGFAIIDAPEPEPEPEPTEPSPPTIEDYRHNIQLTLDSVAQSRNYDSGTTISTYVNSTIPQWAAEAQAFVAWRDAVWAYAYAELDKVESGERAMPSVNDFLAELPGIAWPNEGGSDE